VLLISGYLVGSDFDSVVEAIVAVHQNIEWATVDQLLLDGKKCSPGQALHREQLKPG
jgi:hypothetical protein